MPNSEPTETTANATTAVKHDQRIKRWLLVIAVVAMVFAVSTMLALSWGWKESQRSVKAGQDLAVVVDAACDDPDVRVALGEACPKAQKVKEEDAQQIPIPGLPGRDGQDGVDGVDGQDGIDGARGPRGLRGFRGLPGEDGADGENGADGLNGENGENGADGEDGSDGVNGRDGVSVLSAQFIDGDRLRIELTNGQVFVSESLRGPAGADGLPGAPGADGQNGADGAPGPTCPAGYEGREIEVQTSTLPPASQKIFACVPLQAPDPAQ